ncbi:fructosamine kinase PKL/CAK/FruK [Guyanagaster necrorhizus]|uniref:protein-ribulosamine 3-kinase n=1 Tax=Guyanagaster necrorhizus TaxID=856835 RepID=A0A9P8AZV6_9AGAR|nr:fructosamine kinase PKL/CAK/FruK [Guyanagaster necrorhizus MCA 3950]KAG7452347.1 fructosamine kinase PKL/CAK/FruK [Guyanagaster necrorhizus MCA 3950]
MMVIPQTLLEQLKKVNPAAEFSGSLPRIRSSLGDTYFAKVGRPSEAEQYKGEVESLKAINTAAPGLAPKIIASGVDNGHPYFISDYKDLRGLSDNAGAELGKRLATELHQYSSDRGFGFHVPTFCGATRMKNGWFDTWEECYSEMIGDLLSQLKGKGARYNKLCRKGEEIKARVIPRLLGPLKIKPALLHGDLWSGNTGLERLTGRPIIFDPSSFYGHNEADLAIARIFGGIPQSFFAVYHQHFPKTEPIEQYELRGDLYELFHYLNHTILFGVSALTKVLD